MATPAPPLRPRHRRTRFQSRPRFLVAAAVGLIAAFAIPGIDNPSLRAVIGWDIGAAVFLVLLSIMMVGATPAMMRQRALKEEKITASSIMRTPVTLQFRDANVRMVFEALSNMPQRSADSPQREGVSIEVQNEEPRERVLISAEPRRFGIPEPGQRLPGRDA